MKRSTIVALAATASLLCAGAAQARDVQWSVGINLPSIGTVISNGPGYFPQPGRYGPPVIYQAPPVVYQAPPVVYHAPRPFFGPRIVHERPVVVFQGRRDARWSGPRHDRDGRWDGSRHDRDDRFDRRGHRD